MRYLTAFVISLLLPFHALAQPEQLKPVKHIIVIYLENHSFDNLFGTFPGADGIEQAGDKALQTDADGKPYVVLPHVMNGKEVDKRFPKDLQNKPFLISRYVPENQKTGDLVHRFYQLIAQINGGRMDRFANISNAGGLAMGYYENKHSPLWKYAREFTLADHFFTAGFGGSFLNHVMLICACVPQYDKAPASIRVKLDDKGKLIHDGAVTPDGYAINTIQPFSWPYDRRVEDERRRLPLQKMPTIGERLNAKHIDWAWYSGGWNDAVAGNPSKLFEYHHQPFTYFADYAHGTKERWLHLKDEADFIRAIDTGKLPPVAFYKPEGEFNLHPGYAELQTGEKHIFDLIGRIQRSKLWKNSLIIVTFDDAGGYYDHEPPPAGDRFGPGERVPTLIISPFAKRGFVDHTVYSTISILKLIEDKYGLKPLTERDAAAPDMLNALKP
ncbi:MAG TPA: alkaline phosphatase family protein [Rickettsiales bacterium]|nr:alkaline phosphatase family protein [Rickettsiales bacterium]